MGVTRYRSHAYKNCLMFETNQLERSYEDGFFRLLEIRILNVVLSRGKAMASNYSRYIVSET